ncbi:A-kinase anchor protein 5 [Monodelphis domestica]|uniref:A-kinase anchoring protein 5 n=1 Tax=Monodelphis domestica TaxID=13616 RepID=F7FZI4_MONDO|nr:A-kinase anchor protein 5 [Monodelphis domestica]
MQSMETTVAKIQIESKDEKESVEISPQAEEQVEKASMICFKRRRKSVKALKSKNCSERDHPAAHHPGPCSAKDHTEVEASDQFQSAGGTWASIRRLITRQKRSKSSKKQVPLDAKADPIENTEDTKPVKKKTRSKMKIPCIKLSRRKKKCSHSQMTEESECNLKVKEVTDSLDTKIQTGQDDTAVKDKLITDISGGSIQGDNVIVPQVSNISSSGENVASIELGADNEPSTIHTAALILEKTIEKMEEKQVVNLHQESIPEASEVGHQLPQETTEIDDAVAPDEIPPETPATPETQIMEETSNSVIEQEPKEKEHENGESGLEKNESNDTTVCFSKSDFNETAMGTKMPQLEESKRMEPIAIIVTDTEVSEFDVTKSKNVPKKFLISVENEQSEPFSNALSSTGVNDFEGRTSEQYEKLLMETASSLVKNAIQLSVEQLVNEMDSDDNKRNNLI